MSSKNQAEFIDHLTDLALDTPIFKINIENNPFDYNLKEYFSRNNKNKKLSYID